MPENNNGSVAVGFPAPLLVTLFFSAAADFACKAMFALTLSRSISNIDTESITAVLQFGLLLLVLITPALTPPQLLHRLMSNHSRRNLVVLTTALQYFILVFLMLILNFTGGFIVPVLLAGSILLGIGGNIVTVSGKTLISNASENFLTLRNAAQVCATITGATSGIILGYCALPHNFHEIAIVFILMAVAAVFIAFRIPPEIMAAGEQSDINSASSPIYSPGEKNTVRYVVLAEGIAWSGLIFLVMSLLLLTAIFNIGVTVEAMLLLSVTGLVAGGAIAARLSRRQIQIGLIPAGLCIMAVAAILVGAMVEDADLFSGQTIFRLWWWSSGLIFGLGCGLVIVPARSYQSRYIPPEQRLRAFSVINTINGLLVLIATLVLFAVLVTVDKWRSLPFTLAVMLFLSGGWILWREPRLLTRLVILLVTNSFYRLRVFGRENIPATGPALLVANHVSFIDVFLIAACSSRQIRFMMHESFYRYPLLYPFVKWAGIIEVPKAKPRQLRQLMTTTRQILSSGGIVCVFPEGRITRNGVMSGFKKGAALMMPPELKVPAIPVRLGMIWGSIFTYYYGKIKLRLPSELPHPASVTIGKPVNPAMSGYEMRLLLSEMAAETELIPEGQERPLHSQFASLAKRRPLRKLMKEYNGTEQRELRNFPLLVKAVLLSREIRKMVPEQDKYVGIMLPNTVACVVSVLAVMMADKTPAMINFTASREANEYAIAQADLHCILTSRLFLKKLQIEPWSQMVCLEDMAGKISGWSKLFWTLTAAILPWRELMNIVAPLSNRDVYRTGVIIFSSGSTGTPKGVMLSHHNINSDLFSLIRIMNWRSSDKIVGNLPAFHGFGFTACLWLPIMYGSEVIYVPNPLDAAVIVKTIKKNNVTILLATPGFLQSYMRKGTAEDFKSLRMVVCGAEKMRDDIADKFQDLTGLAVAEGYGCSELSPVVSVNISNSILDLGTRVGKRGSIGAPMPGICVKIVDPETFATLPADTDGLMLVKGATVMQGYLNAPEKTAEVIRDGWYITGDIASMDSRGYITITGRLSRFSKVAGEMVPHELIEKEINQLLQSESRVVAVCGAADAKKGEKLVVFYSEKSIIPQNIVNLLRQRNLPNLWIPRADNFIYIPEIPMLGSGKLDLRSLKKLAAELTVNETDKE